MSLSWIITQSATPQCDKSGLVISVRLTLTLTLTLASSEASFLFQFETKGTGSKISLSISLSSFHLHLQSFLTQTKPLCKFVALALKKWITAIVYDFFNSWTTKCTECLTLERYQQTVAKAVNHTRSLFLFFFLTLHQRSFLLPQESVWCVS